MCPSLARTFRPTGRREGRVHAAPAGSRAEKLRIGAHEHTGSAETLRHPPRNGFTAYIVLSPVSGLVVTVIPEKRELPRNLTPASRRQDHTTSPSASSVSSGTRLNAPDAESVHRSPAQRW